MLEFIAKNWKIIVLFGLLIGFIIIARAMHLTRKEIEVEIEINASDERVWNILSDFVAYPEWNPYIVYIEREMKIGNRLYIEIKSRPHGSSGTFRPTIKRIVENRELRWLGYFFMPGLFDTEQVFTIKPMGKNRVKLLIRGNYKGLLVPFFRLISMYERLSYERMNKALKIRAEEGHSLS